MMLKSLLIAAGLCLLPVTALAHADHAHGEAETVDEMSVTLAPGQGAEVKVEAKQGAKINYSWTVEGGVVNFDAHGEAFAAPDKTHSYKKGRGAASDEGEITAAFDGKHGWFWRNRGDKDVTVKVRATGDYTNFKRVM